MRQTTRGLLLGATMLATVSAGPARAADGDASIASIEQQIHQLQAALGHVRADLAARKGEVAHARAAAEEARTEAREANQRAMAGAGGKSFNGTPNGGFYFPVPAGHYPGVFTAQNLPTNGLGPHNLQTAGEQQASALGQFGRFQLGGVSVQLGGFIEAMAITRTRNETSDFASSFAAVPYANTPQYHEPEFRGTGRQSRISLLIEGKPSTVERVAAYFETDFGSSGTTSNSNESNSYTLRVRQAYATFDNANWGFHVLGGQSYSLVVMDRVGITPRQENLPLLPEGQFHVGFNWTRQAQIRFVKDFDNHRIWAGLSFEEPQTVYVTNTVTNGVIGGTANLNNAGGSLLNATTTYSDDIAPDVIGKLAFDPSFGHYEVYGLARFMHTRDVLAAPAVNSGRNRTVLAGGVGAGMLLPILGRNLVFQATGLAGEGIGRYGSGQIADATVSSNGTPIPIPEIEALLGLVYHPGKAWDLYSYVGAEQAEKRSFNETFRGSPVTYNFGYGNGFDNDTGCATEGSTVCSGQTRGIVEGTLGGWYRFLHGDYGTMEVGTSWSYVRRTAFQGDTYNTAATRVTGVTTPKTDDNIILISFRYLPFL